MTAAQSSDLAAPIVHSGYVCAAAKPTTRAMMEGDVYIAKCLEMEDSIFGGRVSGSSVEMLVVYSTG